jgi:hypothetical protein
MGPRRGIHAPTGGIVGRWRVDLGASGSKKHLGKSGSCPENSGAAEKKTIPVDDSKLIPYKQHPSAANTDENRRRQRPTSGSVSENWIASQSLEDMGFCYDKNLVPHRTLTFPPEGQLSGDVERRFKFSMESLILAQSER